MVNDTMTARIDGNRRNSTFRACRRTAAAYVGIVVVLSACGGTRATSNWQGGSEEDLEASLAEVVEGFRGNVGVYVRHLDTGETAALRADDLFPTASMIKVPLLISTFDAIESHTLAYRDELVYRDSLLYPGVDLLGSFRDGEKIELSKVILLMTSLSDNTAALWLQSLSGGGAAANEWLAANGFSNTRVNSRTPGRQTDWEAYGWGQTTPREMAELLVRIRHGRAVSRAADETMYRMLTKNYWNDRALASIPPWIQAASKNGAVDAARSEVVLVNAPHGDYVFCVATNDQIDQSWDADNEGFALIRRISRVLWNHFEPESSWVPASQGAGSYR